MTVKELKEEIAELPDDMEVVIKQWEARFQQDMEDYAVAKVCQVEVFDYTTGQINKFEALKIY